MPVACWFEGEDEWGAHIYDEIPVPADGTRKEKAAAMTQAMATVFEQAIREHPQDWHMLQRLFVNDLDPERLARSRNRPVGTGTNNGNGTTPTPANAPADPATPATAPGDTTSPTANSVAPSDTTTPSSPTSTGGSGISP
jgi:hypothetical protein